MRNFLLQLILFPLAAAMLPAAASNLQIYFVDVEGGAATLIVTPAGQSLLADTGNPLPDDRDAKRIFQAAQAAGLKKIDYVLITHFDRDHSGGAPALARMITIDKYLDHGDSIETQAPQDAQRWQAYLAIAAGKRYSPKPGDRIPLSLRFSFVALESVYFPMATRDFTQPVMLPHCCCTAGIGGDRTGSVVLAIALGLDSEPQLA